MLIFDLVAGAVFFAVILAIMFVGIRWQSRVHEEAEQALAARRSGAADLVDVGLVSQAELDEAWRYIQENYRELAVR